MTIQNALATAYGIRERRLRHGGDYQRHLEDLRRSEWWTREQLESYQTTLLRDLLQFCTSEVPHYRELLDRAGIHAPHAELDDLARLPLLEKEEVRAEPHRFVPLHPPGRLVDQTTGGTTGTPLRYTVTRSAVQFSYATYEARFRNWAGVSFGERMASMNGKVIVPVEQQRPPFWRYNAAFNQLYLSAYHLSPAHLPSYLDRLHRFRPAVIVGYTSAVHALAQYVLASHTEGYVSPRAVLVSSETLSDQARSDIETAFGCKVHDGYGLGELVAFISECPAGSLHVSPEYGVVEITGAAGEDESEIVATGLRNYGMPLIRYRTGDLCRRAPSDSTCACGRELPIVERILGRVDETLSTFDGGTLGAAAVSLAFQGIPNVRQGQIRQTRDGALVVLVVTTSQFNAEDESLLVSELTKRVGALPMTVERVEVIERTQRGKQRVIVRDE